MVTRPQTHPSNLSEEETKELMRKKSPEEEAVIEQNTKEAIAEGDVAIKKHFATEEIQKKLPYGHPLKMKQGETKAAYTKRVNEKGNPTYDAVAAYEERQEKEKLKKPYYMSWYNEHSSTPNYAETFKQNPDLEWIEKNWAYRQKTLERHAPGYYRDKKRINIEKDNVALDVALQENATFSFFRNTYNTIKNYGEDLDISTRFDPDYKVEEDEDLGKLPLIYPEHFRVVHSKGEAMYLKEKLEKHILHEDSPGFLLGKVLGIFSDPITFLPLPIAAKVSTIDKLSTIKKIATGAVAGGAAEGVGETIRRLEDPFRPIEHTTYGIAGAATITAALTPLFAKYGVPKSIISRLGQNQNKFLGDYEKAFAPNTGYWVYDPVSKSMQTSPLSMGAGYVGPRVFVKGKGKPGELTQDELSGFAKELSEHNVLAVSDGRVIDPLSTSALLSDPALLTKAEVTALKNGKSIKHQTYFQKRLENELEKAYGLEFIKDNPIKRIFQSPDLTVNNIGEGLLTNAMYLKKNKLGIPTQVSVEMKVQHHMAQALDANRNIRNRYTDYITRIKGKEKPGKLDELKTHIRATVYDPARSKYLTFQEFEKRAVLSRFPGMKGIANVHGEEIPEIIKAGQELTPFFKQFKQLAAHQGGDGLNIFERTFEKKLNIVAASIAKAKKFKLSSIDIDGKSTSIKKLVALHKDLLKKEATRIKNKDKFFKDKIKWFKAEEYFPILVKRDLLRNKQKEFLNKWIDQIMAKAPKITLKEATQEAKTIMQHFLKQNTFKPLHPDTTGVASSAHVRKLTWLDWSDEANQSLLLTDTHSITRYYGRSMGADIELSKLSTALGGYGDHSLRDLFSKVSNNWLARANKLGADLRMNPYRYEFDLDKSLAGKIKPRYEKILKHTNDPEVINVGTKNTKLIDKILKRREADLRDLRAMRDLVRGTYGLPENPEGATAIAIRTAKLFNAFTMLTGFIAASVDVARIATYFSLNKAFNPAFRTLFSDLGELKKGLKLSTKQAQAFGEATDLYTASRLKMFSDIPDVAAFHNGLERSLAPAQTAYFTYINGMSAWNQGVKSIASMLWNTEVINVLKQWNGGKGTISQIWKQRLASAGLSTEKGQASLRTQNILKELNTRGGTMKGKYIEVADTSNWNIKNKTAWESALAHDVPKIIVTPSKGDVALWMNTQWGGMLSQFKKFSQAATNRVLTAGLQEGVIPFMQGAVMLVGMGAFVDFIRTEYAFKQSYAAKPYNKKLYDAIERSAVTGYFLDINKSIEGLSSNQIGLRPMLGIGHQYPTSLQTKVGSVLGPTGTTATRAYDVLSDLASGDVDYHTKRNMTRLIPANTITHLPF